MGRKKAKAQETLLASRKLAAAMGGGARRAFDTLAATAPAKAAKRRAERIVNEPLSDAARDRLREVFAIFLLGFTLFLLLAFASSYGERNLCGSTGEFMANLLLGAFGYAAWLIVTCLGLWGGTLFARVQPESLTIRVSGLLLCLVSFAGLLAHLFGDVPGSFPVGGVVGDYINHQLLVVGGLGSAGTLITLVVLTLVTFVLATDIAYYGAIAGGMRWLSARRAAAGGAALATATLAPTAPEVRPARGRKADAAGDEPDAQPDDAALAPFKVLQDEVPEASVPVDAHAAGAPSARPPSKAEEKAARAAEKAAEKAAAAAAKEAEKAAALAAKQAERQAAKEAADKALAEEAAAALAEEEAAAAARAARPAPIVKGPSRDEPVQLQLYGESAGPTPAVGGPWVFPGEELLDEQTSVDQAELDELLAEKTSTLERTLESFKVDARVVEIQKGPVISMFEMELAPGIKVEKVRSLEDDLAIALRARTVRIVAPIPGKNTIGIEVPNPLRETVRLKPLLRCREFTDGKFALPIFLGRDSAGRPMVVDLAKMPHLLVAGATGSGKSVCLNSILVSFLYTRSPEQVKLILIDPKMVELTQFGAAPHLACPVISDMKRAPGILDWAIVKMEERYRLLNQAGVRNIYSYNKLGKEGLRGHFAERVEDPDFPVFLPFIVIVIDELADLMLTAAKEVETSITRLAAKSRAVGIHLIVATQRPSTNVITGLIKANLPTRIAFMVSSKIDSRVILDENGAEQLLGEGDMLVMTPSNSTLVRGQGTFLGEEEVRRVMEHARSCGGASYEADLVQRRSDTERDPDAEDELYDAATRFIFATERGSASLLQRKFAIGYTRASRLIDMMAEEGVLGEYKGSQARELTMTLPEWIALKPDARGSGEGETEAGAAG